ncbi:MAG: hypothetical protein ACE37E_11205 [Hyphomicrobiales bacterium]
MQEAGGLALGGIGLAVVAYAAFSVFVSGPELGQRTINLVHDWPRICQQGIEARAQPQEAPEISMPNINVCRMIFGIYGSDGQAYCDMHGHYFDSGASDFLGTLGDIADALDAPRRTLEQELQDQAIADAPDRCSCATNQVLTNNRYAFAWFAGSARLITPPSIDNLQSELRAALSSPQCDFGG